MADPCNYCHDARLVGWSGAGPILCPECSRGQDAFTVITQAWREQRAKVRELEDCGQDGVCAIAPGCNRHWEERTRELAAERERLNAIAYGESERAEELEAELAKLREERQPLLDLLAVCNRDGGHYAEKHGIARAVRQAKLTVERLFARESAPPGEKGDP